MLARQPLRVDESADDLKDVVSYLKEVHTPLETKLRSRLVVHRSHASRKAGSCPTGNGPLSYTCISLPAVAGCLSYCFNVEFRSKQWSDSLRTFLARAKTRHFHRTTSKGV